MMSVLREKLFHRTLNCLLYQLLRALIGGQANEKASSGNVINCYTEEPVSGHESIILAT
jgi:hypothetical protein